jgi:hypothetical protein
MALLALSWCFFLLGQSGFAQQAKTTRKNQQPTNQETANGTRCATAQSSS